MIPAVVSKIEERWFVALVTGALLCVWAAIYFQLYVLCLVPFGAAFVYLSAVNFKWVYYALIVAIPLSLEVHFNERLGTDLPDEGLMVGLTLLGLVMLALQARRVNRSFFLHPLMLLLWAHFIWMVVCIGLAVHTIVTLKVVLAKIWYIVPFVLLTAAIVQNEKSKRIWFWSLTTPLLFTVVYTLIRHAMQRFSFDSANHTMEPFFRNHVNYAEMLTMVLPFTFAARKWYPHHSFLRRLCNTFSFLLVLGIIFSYTRLAWLSVPVSAVFALSFMKHKLMWVYGLMMGGLAAFFIYQGYNNRYLYHPPDFTNTIQHHNLDAHLHATYGVKDVSNAERLYRWIAGVRMWTDRPLAGYGPGNFYFCYKPYTVRSFRTYVSDNEERSTVHNYYLLTLIEQGAIGCILFLTLITMVIYYAGRAYKRMAPSFDRSFLIASVTCFTVILFNILANDMIETDKVGSLFFMMIAFIVNADLKQRQLPQGIIIASSAV